MSTSCILMSRQKTSCTTWRVCFQTSQTYYCSSMTCTRSHLSQSASPQFLKIACSTLHTCPLWYRPSLAVYLTQREQSALHPQFTSFCCRTLIFQPQVSSISFTNSVWLFVRASSSKASFKWCNNQQSRLKRSCRSSPRTAHWISSVWATHLTSMRTFWPTTQPHRISN